MNGAGKHPMNGADPLYSWWLEAVPNFLSGSTPRSTASASAADEAAAAPSPIGHITQALALVQRLLKPASEAMLQALAMNQSAEAFKLFEKMLQGWTGSVTERLATTSQAASAQPDLAAAFGAGRPLTALAQGMQPLSMSLERAFGGLVDAFGLASSRELQQALRDMAAASIAHRQAQAECLALVAGGLAKGNDALMARLTEMGGRGESVDSVKSLVRQWARAADGAMHVAMQSPAALEASARLLRASTRSQQAQHRIVAIASQALNVPTRAEVDDAYRDIQELKREVRRLRKTLVPEPAIELTGASARPAPRAARKAPAKASSKRAKALATKRQTTAARKSGQKAAST